jgi:hypothetical protein
MNPFTGLVDEIQFDRLVDGELPSDERRRLLASLDDRPGAWRQCAIAFLEAQSWKSDFGQIVHESTLPLSQRAVGRVDRKRQPLYKFAGGLAIAAGLLAAFALGLLSGSGGGGIADGNLTGEKKTQLLVENVDTPGSPSPAAAAQNSRDVFTFWVNDRDGSARQVHVPLVDAAALDRQLGVEFRSGLPAEVREQLRERGYDIQSTRRYAPLWFDNGRSLVVPVEDTRIVPVSSVVF